MDDNSTQELINSTNKAMKTVAVICGIFVAILIALFLPFQNYEWKQPIDAQVFGSFGDLLSGIIGSVIGILSAYLLVRTFQNQAKVNENVVTTNNNVVNTNNSIIAANNSAIAANNNAIAVSQKQWYQTELQVFDSKFRSFMDAYHQAIVSYVAEDKTGRQAFDEIVGKFGVDFSNGNDYKRRTDSAIEEYKNFYSQNRAYLSVHFRLLYLIAALISSSELEDEDMVMYAKLIRGQMSDAEILLLRYNCLSEYGQKMIPYCNQFNLTKHLPVMRLLEFRKYYDILKSKVAINHENLEELTSGLDSMFITLRKRMSLLLWDDVDSVEPYKTSYRYTITMAKGDDRKTFAMQIKKKQNVERRGGGSRIDATEKALDCFEEARLKEMFRDYLVEIFFVSNFNQFNPEYDSVSIIGERSGGDLYECSFQIERNKTLVLTQIQKEQRDNPAPAAI